jgi:hypothetical protein
MHKEMVATDEIIALAGLRIDTYAAALIKTSALRTDATHRSKANSGHLASIDRIEIIKNGAIIQLALIKCAGSSPGYFPTDSQVVKKKKVGSETGIHSAAQGLWLVIDTSWIEVSCGLGVDTANPKLGIELLRMKCSRQYQ